jgi:hypothetical protein
VNGPPGVGAAAREACRAYAEVRDLALVALPEPRITRLDEAMLRLGEAAWGSEEGPPPAVVALPSER